MFSVFAERLSLWSLEISLLIMGIYCVEGFCIKSKGIGEVEGSIDNDGVGNKSVVG